VAVQDLRLAGVPRGGGTVRVQDQGPAPPVNYDLVVKPAQEHAVFGAGLAAVFLVPDVVHFARTGGLVASARQLTTRCANCDGLPPTRFACLACGAALDGHRSAAIVIADRSHPMS